MKVNINSIHLTGRIATAPQLRIIQPSGLPVLNAKLETTTAYLPKERNAFQLNIVFYGVFAEQQAEQLKEGQSVCIEGEILVRSTSPTEKRTTTEIVVERIYTITPPSPTTSGKDDRWDM